MLLIKDGHRFGEIISRKVMVAYYEIKLFRIRIVHLLIGLNATVQGYNQLKSLFSSKVHSLYADAISFLITIGNIIRHIGVKLL